MNGRWEIQPTWEGEVMMLELPLKVSAIAMYKVYLCMYVYMYICIYIYHILCFISIGIYTHKRMNEH